VHRAGQPNISNLFATLSAVAPAITTQPADQIASVGSTVTFSVGMNGFPDTDRPMVF